MDVESGAMINPHNPEFITKRPWYLGDRCVPAATEEIELSPGGLGLCASV
jgi:hypothetical protein